MTSTLIIGGQVVDGSGSAPFKADVRIENDRIVQVAPNLPQRDVDVILDATDRIVAPGFIDIHSHYDAQVFWDQTLSSSCHHGVTSVINGNCGFSLAPYSSEHRGSILRMLRDLEDMPTEVLNIAVPPEIPSFKGYLAEVEARGPMLNFGAYIGHSTVRIAVMGAAAYERKATADEISAMATHVDAALKAGAMGFATKGLPGSRPAPSFFAATEETEALLNVLSKHGRGVAMFSPGGAYDLERVYATQQQVGRPFTWIALMAMPDGSQHERLALHRRWHEKGTNVRPQVSCRALVSRCRMSLPAALRSVSLTKLNAGTETERLAAYADPEWRAKAKSEMKSMDTTDMTPEHWKTITVIESPSAPDLIGRNFADLGAERGKHPFDVLMDLSVADRLATKIEVSFGNNKPDEVGGLLSVEGAVLGLSDAGAHPQQICDAVMPTDLLGHWVRERGDLSLEAAIHKLSQEQALLMGLADRGLVAPGYYADLVVFDAKTVSPGPFRTANDLPGNQERLLADQPGGMHHILINGMITRQNEKPRAARSGRILHPN